MKPNLFFRKNHARNQGSQPSLAMPSHADIGAASSNAPITANSGRLSRNNSAGNNSIGSASHFGTSSNDKKIKLWARTKAKIEAVMPEHLKECKTDKQMAILKTQHAKIIADIKRYRELVAKNNRNLNNAGDALSDAELDERDALIESIYAVVEQAVHDSKPRGSVKLLKLVNEELKVLALAGGYAGTRKNIKKHYDEKDMQRAIVNVMAHASMNEVNGENGTHVIADNDKKIPNPLAVLLIEERNPSLSDLYCAVSNIKAPLDVKIYDAVELSLRKSHKYMGISAGLGIGGATFGTIMPPIFLEEYNAATIVVGGLIFLSLTIPAGGLVGMATGGIAHLSNKLSYGHSLTKDAPLQTYTNNSLDNFEKCIRAEEQRAKTPQSIAELMNNEGAASSSDVLAKSKND